MKSKAAKAAAATDNACTLSANLAEALIDTPTQDSSADWTIAQLSAIDTEYRTQLASQVRRIAKDEAEAHEVVQEAFLKFMFAAPDPDTGSGSSMGIPYRYSRTPSLELQTGHFFISTK